VAVSKEFVYDSSNEALVLRAAIALARESDRTQFRALVHSIGEDEFLVAQHSSLWRVLRRTADGGLEYTTETVLQLMAAEPSEVDVNYLAELERAAVLPANLDWHVQTLRWDATRARVVKNGLPELVRDLSDPRVTVDRAVTSARSIVRALEGGGGRKFIHRREELAAVYRTELAKRRDQGNFYPCGFEHVDGLMSEGFKPGNTAIITGLSGSGKSTFAARLAINLARLGRRPMICAWEMGGTSTLDVIVSMLTGISLDIVIKGTYNDLDCRRLERASDWANKKILFMENAFFGQLASSGGGSSSSDRKQRRSNDRNLDILEGYIAESGCDEIIMDLWDRILADQNPDAVTDALYRQQNMHREYGVHGTLLVQLRLKDVERRADKRPTRESIKGVGTFVEVADLIFGVHRDAQFKDVPDNTIELICLKQRKGRSNWAVRFGWCGEICEISGGEEVPYNPGLEATGDYGDIADPSAIRTSPRKMNRRD
jgi:replicative DNA helicase